MRIVICQFETFSIVLWLAIILVLDVSCASNNQLKSRGVGINQNLAFRSVAERRDAERRAVAGDVEAAKELGDCCLYVDNDFAAAKRWFKLAASYGDKDAKASLKTLDDIEKGKD